MEIAADPVPERDGRWRAAGVVLRLVTRRRVVVGLAVLLSLLVPGLGACSTPSPSLTAIPTATPFASATPAPTPTPTLVAERSGGEVTLAVPVGPTHLDVHQEVAEGLTSMGPGIVYSRLLRLKSGPEIALPSLEVECDLCVTWQHPDPLTYTFRLKEGVRWHALPPVNGRTLTAEDVVFSLQRLRTAGSPGATLLNALATVEASDALTVSVRLTSPDADFLLALAGGQAKVVAPESVAVRGHLRDGPTVGTGPWVLTPEAEQGFEFSRNPRYFERGFPKLERLKIEVIAQKEVRIAALLAGRIHLTTVPLDEWPRLQQSGTSVQSGVFPQPGTGVLMALKATASPLDRVKVRQAIFLALDPAQALEEVWQGQGDVSVGMPLTSREWVLPAEQLKGFFNDLPGSKKLLAEAGLPSPIPLTVTVADFGDRYLALGEAYKGRLGSAGFEVALEVLNPRLYAEQVWDSGLFQAFLGPVPPVSSPNAFLLTLLHSQGVRSLTGYADPELDRRIEAFAIAEEGRSPLALGLQRYVLDKAILFMPVTGTSLWAWRDGVEGFAPNFAASEYFHWARLRVKE